MTGISFLVVVGRGGAPHSQFPPFPPYFHFFYANEKTKPSMHTGRERGQGKENELTEIGSRFRIADTRLPLLDYSFLESI